MALGRYVVDAVLLEGRSAGEVARAHGISRYWLYKLIARYREGGYAALEPRSRRPRSCAHAVAQGIQAAIVRLRGDLAAAGHNSARTRSPTTFASNSALRPAWRPSGDPRAPRADHPTAPQAPASSFIRPRPTAQRALASRQHPLAARRRQQHRGIDCLDDHSRLLVVADAYVTVKAADVVKSLSTAWEIHGFPAAFLSDNGAVFSGKSRKGKVLLKSELERLGIVAKHSTASTPPDLRQGRTLPPNPEEVPRQAGTGRDARRPPGSARCLPHLLQPAPTPSRPARQHAPPRLPPHVKAQPNVTEPLIHYRVRHDRVNKCSVVTLRYLSRLHHISLGADYRGRPSTSWWPTRTSGSSARTDHSFASWFSTRPGITSRSGPSPVRSLELSTMS